MKLSYIKLLLSISPTPLYPIGHQHYNGKDMVLQTTLVVHNTSAKRYLVDVLASSYIPKSEAYHR